MKRSLSLRGPFGLLPLRAVVSLISFRVTIRCGFQSGWPTAAVVVSQLLPNATNLSLSMEDPSEAVLRKDVDGLLEGNFPASGRMRAAMWWHRSTTQWRRENSHPDAGLRAGTEGPVTLRLRSPQNYEIFQEVPRSVREWLRNRRFQPQIVLELVDQVKRPIDRHYGLLDLGQRYASWAVVGNSGILLKSDYGELIDGHELVIRINNAQMEGYKRNVGSKTGLSFVNSNFPNLCARRHRCFCHPYGENVPMITFSRPCSSSTTWFATLPTRLHCLSRTSVLICFVREL